jgi:hypothetical protein
LCKASRKRHHFAIYSCLFIAWCKGLLFELKEDSFLPAPTVEILREKAELTPEQVEYLNTHTLIMAP